MSAQDVADGKPVELGNQFFCACMKIPQRQIVHFVDAFDLPNQQFRIADHFERLVAVAYGILERGDQSLILGKIVGLVAEIFAERGNSLARFILDNNSVTRRPGIAACTAIDEGDKIMLGRTFAQAEEFSAGAR